MFSVPHVPDFQLICQAERHGSQLAHALAHREASKVGHQLVLLVFCEPKVRDDLIGCSRYIQRRVAANDSSRKAHLNNSNSQWLSVFTFSSDFFYICQDKVILDRSGGVRGITGGGLVPV